MLTIVMGLSSFGATKKMAPDCNDRHRKPLSDDRRFLDVWTFKMTYFSFVDPEKS